MDIKQKKNILAHLAIKAGKDSAALNALKKEADKIARVLESETQYDNVSAQIDLLDTISYCVYEKAVEIFATLLERLKTVDLTHQEIPGYPVERLRQFQNNDKLVINILEALQHIRYHDPEKILDVFFQYSIHENEDFTKQAITGIESLAGYDRDIFYGDGKAWKGLGWEPQEKVLAKIESYDQAQKKTFLRGILAACNKMLSPTVEGTRWSYDKVVFTTGALPAVDDIKVLRTQVLDILKVIYRTVETLEDKKHILGVMKVATDTPHRGNYGDDVLKMVVANTITVLEFMKEIASTEDMQIMQKIEHDAYWLFYHKHEFEPRIGLVALEIRDLLLSHEEYQKFRVLIGFESIFHEWKKGKTDQDDYERERKYRETEALRLSRSINEGNYEEWKHRIISYAGIKSNDMATFPYFGKFLENFGKESPALALKLLSDVASQLEGFLVAILCGAAQTALKPKVYKKIADWADEGKYLFSLAHFFEFSEEINQPLLANIFEKAQAANDLNTLSQIISAISAQFAEGRDNLIKDFFIPAIRLLTQQKDSRWIFVFWFRKQRGDLLAAMDKEAHQAILDNLFWLNEIDYQAEEVLSKIADRSPDLVLEFFCKRISKEKTEEGANKFEAVPFSFHKLSEPLSKIPEAAVDIVLKLYDGDYGLFIYRGARLLKNIFPNFPESFERMLIQVVHMQNENNWLFVMAILRNYEGQPFLHKICKELVRILPEDSNLLGEVRIILQSTGVVHGAYGFTEAYQRKIEEIMPWLEDRDEKIKKFAEGYSSGLQKQIEAENKRVDEDIALRKHQYGTDDDSESD